VARQHKERRVDKAVVKISSSSSSNAAGPDAAVSESGYLKRARLQISELAPAGVRGLTTSFSIVIPSLFPSGGRQRLDSFIPDVWTASHDKERAFQTKKFNARRVEALIDGTLLPDEVDGELQAAATREVERRQVSSYAQNKKTKKRMPNKNTYMLYIF